MRRMTWLLSVIGLAVAGLPVLGAAGAQEPSPPVTAGTASIQADTIAWGPCEDELLQEFEAECATVQVPLDYRRPHGERTGLGVSRVRHTVPDSEFQGVMLVNPGGPGGSGLIFSILGGFVPNGAGEYYDWIGFDPRGVGSSQGALSCIPDYFDYDRPSYVPTTRHLERVWLDRSKAYARACARNNDAGLLSNMTTVDVARDMDRIRRALGQQQINFYGFSYGTYLGQVYSTLFPQRVRRMVLDGNVDPRRVWYDSQFDQDRAFERNVEIYFDWIAQYDDVYHLGRTGRAVERLYYKVQAQLDRHPAGGLIGPAEWNDLFLGAAYYIFDWETIAEAFEGWVHRGEWEPLRDLYDAASGIGDDNGFAVYLGVQCTDAPWPQAWARWRRDTRRVHEVAPFVTWNNTWFNAPCLFWPADSATPVDIDGRRVPSALLISEELDTATPYEGSLEVRSRFPGSRLIAGPGGTTHAASLFGNACVDDQIAEYLATGGLPPRLPGRQADALCDPLPPPVPEDAAAESLQRAPAGSASLAALRQQLREAAGPLRVG